MTSAVDGTDTLANVERLKFADASVALDLSGNAGTVAKILGAVFGMGGVADPGYRGIGLHFVDGGMSYESLMQLAIDARLGAGAGPQAVVDLLYTNIVGYSTVGFVPPPNRRPPLSPMLVGGDATVAGLGVMAADLDLNTVNIDLVGLAQQGMEYVPYIGGRPPPST